MDTRMHLHFVWFPFGCLLLKDIFLNIIMSYKQPPKAGPPLQNINDMNLKCQCDDRLGGQCMFGWRRKRRIKEELNEADRSAPCPSPSLECSRNPKPTPALAPPTLPPPHVTLHTHTGQHSLGHFNHKL